MITGSFVCSKSCLTQCGLSYFSTSFSSGKKSRRHSHIRLVLREIDFPTKLLQATSVNQKRKWLEALKSAREDYDKATVEREELAELEAMAAQLEEDARKKREEEEGNN